MIYRRDLIITETTMQLSTSRIRIKGLGTGEWKSVYHSQTKIPPEDSVRSLKVFCTCIEYMNNKSERFV